MKNVLIFALRPQIITQPLPSIRLNILSNERSHVFKWMLGNGFFIFRKMTNEIEIWKDVVGYEGLYEISNIGRVRTVERDILRSSGVTEHRKSKIMSPFLNKGYPTTTLYNGTHKKHWGNHRLVAEAFIPNPENKYAVNHIDGNKANPFVGNLEWVTMSENSYHAHHTGLSVNPVFKGSAHGMAKLTEDKVIEIRKLHSEGMKHRDLREKFGIGKSPLCRIIARTAWSHI